MKYNLLGKTKIKVSEIGLGCEHLEGEDYNTVKSVIDAADECGINCMDVFMSNPQIRSDIGQALVGRRERFVIQGHIGSVWKDGQYGRSRDAVECRIFFEDLLNRLHTDYIDIGMFHCVDTKADADKIFGTEMEAYGCELKSKGAIRALGISTHDPLVALRAAKSGIIDVIMFSLNPAFDMLPEDIDDVNMLFEPSTFTDNRMTGMNHVRAELYSFCEASGVGITVMKAMGAGSLLSNDASPFGQAMTPVQCLHYALTRPAVASVMAGVTDAEQIRAAAAYETASVEEKDYAGIIKSKPSFTMRGRCMYCNHCLPCPAHIDVASVNKYLDMASVSGGNTAALEQHYALLEHKASECTGCKSCEKRCPFGVLVSERMKAAANIFEK